MKNTLQIIRRDYRPINLLPEKTLTLMRKQGFAVTKKERSKIMRDVWTPLMGSEIYEGVHLMGWDIKLTSWIISQLLLARNKMTSPVVLLDIAAGQGGQTVKFAKALTPDILVATEADPSALNKLKKSLDPKSTGVKQISIKKWDLWYTSPIKDNSINIALLLHVLPFFPLKVQQALLLEVASKLKWKGLLGIIHSNMSKVNLRKMIRIFLDSPKMLTTRLGRKYLTSMGKGKTLGNFLANIEKQNNLGNFNPDLTQREITKVLESKRVSLYKQKSDPYNYGVAQALIYKKI